MLVVSLSGSAAGAGAGAGGGEVVFNSGAGTVSLRPGGGSGGAVTF